MAAWAKRKTSGGSLEATVDSATTALAHLEFYSSALAAPTLVNEHVGESTHSTALVAQATVARLAQDQEPATESVVDIASDHESEAPVVASRVVEPPMASTSVADLTVPEEGKAEVEWAASSSTSTTATVTSVVIAELVSAAEAIPPRGSHWGRKVVRDADLGPIRKRKAAQTTAQERTVVWRGPDEPMVLGWVGDPKPRTPEPWWLRSHERVLDLVDG